MEAVFLVAALTSVTAIAAAQRPAPAVEMVANNISTSTKPAVIIIHGKRPTLSEKIAYWRGNTMENYGMR